METNCRNQENDDHYNMYGIRKINYWDKYGVRHFPYRGKRRFTPSIKQSFDGGIIISNDVFGLTIKQFEQTFKDCLEKRKIQEQWILNLRYPDKSSNAYLIYLQNFTDSRKGYGRCLVNFFYYSELDLCYKFGPPIKASNVNDDSVCPGSELIRVDSDERQDYIKLVTADIGNVYKMGIFIQGKKIQVEDKWTYNDGSTMEYLRWLPGHPDRLSNVIGLWRSDNYLWFTPHLGNECTYMCEYRPQNYIIRN